MAEPRGFTVWFTGLSGAGKSTVARIVADELRRRGARVELLAGGEFRQNISQGLGFSREDRIANVRRIGYVAKLLARNGIAVITTAVSPDHVARDECRREIGDFLEVYVQCPLDVCEARDPKGLYSRARLGELDVAGIGHSYEPPLHPDVVLDSAIAPPEKLAGQVLAAIEERGWIGPQGKRGPDPDEEFVKAQLRALFRR